MRVVTAREFQKNFGTYTDLVLSGESVRITKHGRPAYTLVPESSDPADIERRAAADQLSSLLKTAKTSEAAKGLGFDDIAALIDGRRA